MEWKRILRGSALAGFAMASACGGGGGGSSQDSSSVEFLVKDSPLDGVASLRASVAGLSLVNVDGERTANLLPDPVEVEFLGLRDRSAWLSRIAVMSFLR